MRARSAPLAAALGLIVALPAAGHDFWIEPSTFSPTSGQRVTVRLRVGEHFLGDPVPRDESLLVRFVAAGSTGEEPIYGVHGRDPAGLVVARGTGTLVVGFVSAGTVVELDAAKLARYVAEEGLGPLLPADWQRATTVRDRFSRSVKSLLAIRGDNRTGWDRVLGLPLELVPLVDPSSLAGGGDLPLRLLEGGAPAAGRLVTAIPRLDPTHPVAARTGADGRVTLPLPRGGRWLVKAVKTVPAAPGSEVDYESVWTSLTFEAPAP